MKKTGVRQMIFGILGSLACGVSVMGCYPLVPAYFTALYLEQVNGVVLLAFMYIGMTLFMPLTAAVKYGVTLIVMIGAVDRKSTRLNSSHPLSSRMPSSA